MENYQAAGDLTDIVRTSGGGIPLPPNDEPISSGDWRFPPPDLMTTIADFGDPFSDLRDPLLHELNTASTYGSTFFFNCTPNSSTTTTTPTYHDQETSRVFGVVQKPMINDFDDDRMMKRSSACNIFSRMLQISPITNSKSVTTTLPVSPCHSPAAAAASPRGSIINANSSSKGCIVDSTTCLQISSPPNPGIKRRKSQAKKVVCIPAPAPAPVNSRPSGEIVPSDLWAWRKYGQKPIKGSPYPRGYYRCSSSKCCSARKQVERSRTDPNMLVITYTSEHNHSWPTQRNALAGSTRSQPSKTNKKDINISSTVATGSSINTSNASVKEEMEDIDEGDQFNEGFPSSYKPTMPDSNLQPAEDFFADLGEIEANPLSIFRSGDDSEREIKGLDPFSIFDWPGNNNTSSFGEAKRGL